MPVEIERKFLLISDDWRSEIDRSVVYRQGYLSNESNASVRIRVSDDTAYINVKSMTKDIERLEFEYPIPLDEARQQLNQLCQKPLVEKIRHYVKRGKHTWEIDEFSGDNQGLVVAEIELNHANEAFEKPTWLGKEVSHLPRYFNIFLGQHPYKDWNDSEKAGD